VFRFVLFRGHPERVRCLISLSDFERRCRCCTSLRVTTGYAYASRGGPRAWADALHRVTRTHTYALAHTCLSHSTTAPRFLSSSRTVRLCSPLLPPLITILIAVKVLPNDLSECHWFTVDETFLPRCIAVHMQVRAALQSSG